LLHIVRSSELSLLSNDSPDIALNTIRQSAGTALTLLDSYLLGLELADTQDQLELSLSLLIQLYMML